MSGLLKRANILHDQFLEMESIPLEEREKIIAEIDTEMKRGKLRISNKTFRFSSVRKDSRLPLIINLSALTLITLLGIFMFQRFKSDEESLITRSRTLNQTESHIIRKIQKESEQKLDEKNREIEGIMSDMDRLQNEKSLLVTSSRAEIARLEKALKEEMESHLLSEEEKLKSEGLDPMIMEERLTELKERLDADFIKSREELIRRVEDDRLRQEELLLTQIEGYKNTLQSVEAERNLLLDERSELLELRQLRENSLNEEFILNQISSTYKQIAESISRGNYTQAELSIVSLEKLIDREDGSGYPGLDSRKAADRLLLNALVTMMYLPAGDTENEAKPAPLILETGLTSREEELQELIARGNAHYEAGEEELSRGAYMQAFALFPPLTEGYDHLRTMDISKEQQRLAAEGYALLSDEQRALLDQAVREKENKEELMTELDRIQLAVEEEENPASDQEELVEMLRMKVLLKEVLVSDAVREEYPDLTSTLERYLQSYGILKESSGKSLVLMDINEMMDALGSGRPYTPAGGDELQTGLYLSFLEQLKGVLNAPE